MIRKHNDLVDGLADLNAEYNLLLARLLKARKLSDHWMVKHDELKAKLDVYEGIVNESSGVVGWHLNGDVATWYELLDDTPAAFPEPEKHDG